MLQDGAGWTGLATCWEIDGRDVRSLGIGGISTLSALRRLLANPGLGWEMMRYTELRTASLCGGDGCSAKWWFVVCVVLSFSASSGTGLESDTARAKDCRQFASVTDGLLLEQLSPSSHW